MNKRIIGYAWFTAKHTVGIVLTQDTITNEIKCWIAPGDGVSEAQDVLEIMDYGAKFPVLEGASIITKLGKVVVGKDEWDKIRVDILAKNKIKDSPA